MNIFSKKSIKKATGFFVCGTFLLTAPLVAFSGVLAGPTGTIPDAGIGDGINVQLTPGVQLGYTLEADGATFAINTSNASIDYASGSRNEYGIASDYTGYYMAPATEDTIVAPAADDSAAFPTADFSKM